MTPIEPKPLEIKDYDPNWPKQFRTIAEALRGRLGDNAARIDHIGSTAVHGLPAKDLIDIQVTVERLGDADRWSDELVPGLMRRHRGTADDHVPPGTPEDPRQWPSITGQTDAAYTSTSARRAG